VGEYLCNVFCVGAYLERSKRLLGQVRGVPHSLLLEVVVLQLVHHLYWIGERSRDVSREVARGILGGVCSTECV
jgi:hypothetical protein